MSEQIKKTPYKKIALVLSLCALLIWTLLGTGASLAWFTDESPEIVNNFQFADFDLDVYHLDENKEWKEVTSETKLFDEEALYEPGYVQVVYLKVKNNGDVPFDLKAAVTVNDYTPAVNVFEQKFNLQDHLKFGLVSADTEQMLYETVASRTLAKEKATEKLGQYFKENPYEQSLYELEENGELYLALIVRMPEEVGNEANYRGNAVPKVELGVTITATQQKD